MAVEDFGVADLELVEEIGRGGFGVVYRARQAGVERDVAVKLLAVHSLDPDARSRFQRECRVLGALSDHPHIVTVHGSGVAADGRPYLVMAFLRGGSLADRLQRDGQLPWQEAVAIAVKLAGALETAHRAGVLHRDVKPENVLVTGYGEPALADFGIARVAGETQTRTGHVTATLAHAAPEVLDGQRPTERADVYSLASTAFTLVAGHPPFEPDPDGGISQLIARVLTQPVPDLRAAGVPMQVCTALEEALAKSPGDRPSAAAFGERLIAAQRELGAVPTVWVVHPSALAGPLSGSSPASPAEAATAAEAPTPTSPPAGGDEHRAAPVPAAATRAHVRSSPPGSADPVAFEAAEPAGGRRRLRALIGIAAGLLVVALLALVTFRPGPADPGGSGDDRVLWTRAAAVPSGQLVAVTVAGGRAFLVAPDELVAVDGASGVTAWSRAVLRSETSGDGLVAAVDDLVAAVTDSDVTVFQAGDGTVLSTVAHRSGSSAVHAVDGRLYAVSGTVLAALDGSDGQVEWEVDSGDAPVPAVVLGEEPADDGLLAVVAGTTVSAVDTATGQVGWEHDLGAAPVATAAGHGGIFVAALSGAELQVVALDAVSGDVVWSRSFRSPGSAAAWLAWEDSIVVVGAGAQILALAADTGDPSWEAVLPDALAYVEIRGGTVVALAGGQAQLHELYGGEVVCTGAAPEPAWTPAFDGRLYITTRDSGLHVLDNCQEVWAHELPAGRRPAGPVMLDWSLGAAVLTADDGSMVALRVWDD